MSGQAYDIKRYILKNVTKHPADIVLKTAEHFGVTRTTVHRHLNTLVKEQKIIKSGTTRNIQYYKVSSLNRNFTYKMTPKLSEFDVFEQDFETLFRQFSDNLYDIFSYSFTEIFNNAIDHSRGSVIRVTANYIDNKIILSIKDNGIGIFKNVYDYFGLDDIRESILQLNKGKMTTDPARHTGEGLFFTSRIFDQFEIYANNLHYFKDNIEHDWAVETTPKMQAGSKVVMTIRADSKQNLVKTFKRFQNDNLSFSRTEITVELARFGHDKLVSRSQAKRITRGLEKFHHITLDFAKVTLVGQGFVDEIFRVYLNQHPGMVIDYINASEDAEFMIKRGIATAKKLK